MLRLEKADYSDIDLLYEWANDTVVRQNSFNSDKIPYDTHVKWFTKMMNDPSVVQYILYDDIVPVGQVRLNIEGDEAEISYSVSPEYRGKGYGRELLRMIYGVVKGDYPKISTLVARVKPDNMKSKSLFEDLGYDLKYLCYIQEVDHS